MPDLTYTQLKAAVTALAKTVTRDADAIRAFAQQTEEEATDTARVADGIGALRVDTQTVAETHELSSIMRGLSETAIQYAAAGDNTAKAATAAHEQAQRTHAGMQEAFNRSPVDLRDVDREWFRQE